MTLADDPAALRAFYDDCYAPEADSEAGSRYARWRQLGAVAKADHVVALCRRGGLDPRTVVDVGCGDGAMLAELTRRGFTPDRRVGFELSASAVPLAREQPGVDEAHPFDGAHLPVADGAFDVAILSHVLEHVVDPAELLREAARAARAVVFEVPLEDNRSARRPAKRAGARAIGHLHRFSRAQMHAIAAEAGLQIAAELSDPLGRDVHRFFASTPKARLAGDVKWGVRRALATVPAVGERLITVHYAALAVPAPTAA